MNDQEFEQLAHANPWDQTAEFLKALKGNPAREELVEILKSFDSNTLSGLSIPVPESLKQTLLAIPEQNPEQADNIIKPSFWQWQKTIPIAASLVLVSVLLFNNFSTTNEEYLTNEVVAHVYHEIGALDWNLDIDIPEVNERFSAIGGQFETTGEVAELDVDAVMDCWVAKENSLHMIVKGNVGQVTVMVIPNEPVIESFSIEDERFKGLVSPTEGGNLVVMGEKEEQLDMYQDMIIADLSW